MSDKMTREEAIDVLKHNYPSACFTDLCEAVEIAIQALSAQPERKKGKWGKAYDGNDGHVKCTGCFKTYDWISQAQYYNYCPNCGSYNGGDKDDQC